MEEFVRKCIRDWITTKERHLDSPFAKALVADIELRKNDSLDEMLMRQARLFINTGDDDVYENFAELCAKNNRSPETFIEALTQNANLANIEPVSQTTLAKCINWLGTRLTPGSQVSAVEIFEEGESLGFAKHQVKDAKRRLGIISRRDGKQWIWLYDDTGKVSAHVGNNQLQE